MAVPNYGLRGGLVEIPSRSLADVDDDLYRVTAVKLDAPQRSIARYAALRRIDELIGERLHLTNHESSLVESYPRVPARGVVGYAWA